ncbi:MAG: DM13 domain-containing protein [Thermoleophilaceae bacterium]|nr:DM13 domain-containing protein [Thermoleophilaceae bacterium]
MSRSPLRSALGGLIVAFLAVSAVYSGGFFGLRDALPPPAAKAGTATGATSDAFTSTSSGATAASPRRSQPWWQPVATFSGDRDQVTRPFAIADHAIQWRTAWECERGAFGLQPRRPSGQPFGHPLAQASSCPEEDVGYSVKRGPTSLAVRGGGPWRARVEQQVDLPLVEPPLPAMTSRRSRVLARGRFDGVDRVGEGEVRIYRLGDRSAALRLEDFYVSPNVDLEIWLSESPRPRTTRQARRAPFRRVVFLDATAGSMNFRVPDGVDLGRYRSIVIWCEITHNAYASAPLRG